MPRSSIAAVVSRRAEIGLTDEQVGEMERIDLKRDEENAAVREELEKEHEQPASTRPPGAGAGGGRSGPQGMRGGGMRGGIHGGRMGGGMPAAGSSGAKKTDRQATLEDRLDENDTKAYLDAENVLTEAQKSRARDIASDYRERLYEERDVARSKAASSK